MKRILFKTIRLTLKDMQELLNRIVEREEIKITLCNSKFENMIYGYDSEKEAYYRKKNDISINDTNVFISVLNQEIAVYTHFDKSFTCYWSYLEDDFNKMKEFQSGNFKTVKGSDCFRIMQQYNKLPKINSYHEAEIESINQLFYKNPKYLNKKIKNCICYDINSAFSFIQLNYYIDFKDLGEGIVKDDEIGFNFRYKDFNQYDLETTYLPVEKDMIAQYRFKRIAVPEGIYRFVKRYYSIKDKGHLETKQKAKNVLNFSIGESNNHCWYYRALIVSESNLRVYKLIKMIRELYGDVVLYANTDCIATTCKIAFLDNMIGHEIGEFKIEKTGTLYMNNEAYQWNRSKPVYSGIPSFKFERFKEEYHKQMDLAKEDELIKLKGFLNNETKYMLDVETLKIKPFNNIIDKNNNQILYGLKKGKFKVAGGLYGKESEQS